MTKDRITLDAIAKANAIFDGRIIRTPMLDLRQNPIEDVLPKGARGKIKLELFQKAGSFKARGALLSIESLTAQQARSGVVAASGGNHALAVSWAARAANVSVKITIPKAADPVRIDGCRHLGADVILCDDIAAAFAEMERIKTNEGRSMIHPFEGYNMSLGAATCGKEFYDDFADVEVVVLPVGGGGLISGMSAALKVSNPEIKIYGVEPFGADTLYRSFQAGSPQSIDRVATIADSLGSPTALPYSYALARKGVDEIVRVSDDDLRDAMKILYDGLKIVAEPACAASLAAAIGPLREICAGKKIGLIACGSNIGLDRFRALTNQM